MTKTYILYNPHAGTGNSEEHVRALEVLLDDKTEILNITKITNYSTFLGGLDDDDYLIIAGGDGTLNRFINDTRGLDIRQEILYYPIGTGNDFAHDLGRASGCAPFPIREYLKSLPYIEINGKTCRFLNGIGYGIDGYCCEVGDELRKIPGKKVNYTAIAVKGLLFHYKPTRATVTVDGVLRCYNKVWLAPTMHGRFYGGGMIPTPNQSRTDADERLSTMVLHSCSKLKTLMIFPSIFKGAHVKYKDCVEILEGSEITVEFDRPTALQIDGETVLGVTAYTARTADRQKTLSRTYTAASIT